MPIYFYFLVPILIRPLQNDGEYRNVVVTRGNVLKTLMAHFENDDVFDFHLYIHFANHLDFEQGVGIGVSREAFTQFFVEFLDLCCVGDRTKVPYPKQGLCKDNWKAIARVFGYATIYNIFPQNLCRTAAKMHAWCSCKRH